jgi:flagella basal body P-ring formation protein FlgA
MSYHIRHLLPVVIMLWLGSQASAVEIMLRAQATLGSPVVRLGDVADVSGDTDIRLNNLITTPLIPAPAPDTVRFLRATQVRDLLALRGISLEGVSLSGAEVVTISQARETSSTTLPVNLTPERHEQIRTAVQQTIQSYLHQMAPAEGSSYPGVWDIQLRLDRKQLCKLARFDTSWTVTGGRKPWTGKQLFRLTPRQPGGLQPASLYQEPSGPIPNRHSPNHKTMSRTPPEPLSVAVHATVERTEQVVVAVRSIQRDMLVRASDVELRSHPAQAATGLYRSLESVVGMVAKVSIRPDTVLRNNQLRKPILVERGETVGVSANTAGVRVWTHAVAKQNGAMGDLVQVETDDDKRIRYTARVVGRRELQVFIAGRTAAELTTLKPRNGQLR